MTSPTVYLNVPLSPFSGYGADGIGIAQSLIAAGAEVFVESPTTQRPLPPIVNEHINREVRGPFDLAIVHVDPQSMKVPTALRENARTVIGWTMWEYTTLDNLPRLFEPVQEATAWVKSALDHARQTGQTFVPDRDLLDKESAAAAEKAITEYRKDLEGFDALVAYDSVTRDALRPYFDGPIIVVQGGYDPAMWAPIARDWTTPEFRFCMIGVLSERKDPFVAVQAFGLAKERDPDFNRWARLSLKTTATGLHSKMEDMFGTVAGPDGKFYEQAEDGTLYQSLRIFYDIWPTDVVRQFYAANHVLVSPSRGEGKNMPALEFMSTGGTVIATNWAGHTQWMSRDYAYPLDYTLAPSSPGSPALNARASVEHLADLMLHTFHHRDEARRKGEVARDVIPAMCAWPIVLDRLLVRLADELKDDREHLLAIQSGLNFRGKAKT